MWLTVNIKNCNRLGKHSPKHLMDDLAKVSDLICYTNAGDLALGSQRKQTNIYQIIQITAHESKSRHQNKHKSTVSASFAGRVIKTLQCQEGRVAQFQSP